MTSRPTGAIGTFAGPKISPRTLDDATLEREAQRLHEAYVAAAPDSASERAAGRWFDGLAAEIERRNVARRAA